MGFSSRGLVVLWGLLGLPAVAHAGIEAYAWPASVSQGQSLYLYISSPVDPLTVEIFREGATSVRVANSIVQGMEVQSTGPTPWASGAGWYPTLSVSVPTTWTSGVYTVRCSGSGSVGWCVFVVRDDVPGSRSPLLVQLATTTWQAYNAWGGKSLYDHSSSNGQRASEVSFRRPYDAYQGLGQLPIWELPFIRWLEAAGYTAEYCTSLDLHRDPGLLSRYQAYVSVGHDEYWSREMRDQVEAHVAARGHAAFFSGNTCWWQARFSAGGDRMICYKSKTADPLYRVDDSRVTVKWHDDPVFRPETAMTGVSSRYGGYVNTLGWYPESEGYGGYTAVDTGHWVFAGTGLGDGAVFGRTSTIVGYETDGALLIWDEGVPRAAGISGTPLSFRVLGVSPASNGYATLGLFERGGTVFTAATTDWSHGLGEPAVSRITRNVLDAMLGLSGALLVNDPPLVVAPPDQANSPSRSIDLPITVFDPELGSVSFSAAGLPPGLSVDSQGFVRGIIAENAASGSPYSPQVTVTDDGTPSRSTTVAWSWIVDAALGVGSPEAPLAARLEPPAPNPMRHAARFRFTLDRHASAGLAVIDLNGRVVRGFEATALDPGEHEARWDGRDSRGLPVAPGAYFVVLTAGSVRQTRKLIVLEP
jgi:hypothetical protein